MTPVPVKLASPCKRSSECHATKMSAIAATAAGMSRRNRRTQNSPRAILPSRACSASRSEVIKKPDRVKNVETPRNPPDAQANSPWNTRTAATARPRKPSRAGKWGNLVKSAVGEVSGVAWVVGRSATDMVILGSAGSSSPVGLLARNPFNLGLAVQLLVPFGQFRVGSVPVLHR